MGTADDVRPVNTTTPFVDQNQTYTSHASHQVFLRQYALDADGVPHATGKLIEGHDGTADAGGMATWGEVKEQAKMLGILLTDQDVGDVPLLRTDQYGNFIPGATGFAQVITASAPTAFRTRRTTSSSPAPRPRRSPLPARSASTPPSWRTSPMTRSRTDSPTATSKSACDNPGNDPAVYDNELLDAHFIAGDGRANENIGLTAVHHVFHSEHNRLVEHTKEVVLAEPKRLADGASRPRRWRS